MRTGLRGIKILGSDRVIGSHPIGVQYTPEGALLKEISPRVREERAREKKRLENLHIQIAQKVLGDLKKVIPPPVPLYWGQVYPYVPPILDYSLQYGRLGGIPVRTLLFLPSEEQELKAALALEVRRCRDEFVRLADEFLREMEVM